MSNIWFTSDSHFGHANFLTFRDHNDHPVRPFTSVEEMDEHMIERWNSVVRDGDKVYHLGDVCFDKSKFADTMSRLKGSKRLVLGNHDDLKRFDMLPYFKKVQLWRIFTEHDFVCSHVPLAREQFRKVTFNLHGHIHQKPEPSPNHICVCVERTNYTPVHLDEVLAEIAKRKVAMMASVAA